MNEVNREQLLQQLESVMAGLSARDIIEQSSCFVFKDGAVITYNDEISCSHPCGLNIEGAVQAEPLVDILRKLKEETIDVEVGDSELIIKGRRRSAGIRMEKEIVLPVENVERATKWKTIPEDFAEAVNVVKDCAGSDQSTPILTCIHIHPDRIEASDNYQVTRYKCKTGVVTPVLVKRDSIRNIVSLDVTKFAETSNWIHFRNRSKLVLSCRRYEETFPSLDALLNFKGERITLPKGLSEAVEKAQIFSADNPDDNQIKIIIRTGKFRIRGEGGSGWFTEFTKTKYKGPAISFFISPELLVNLTTRHNECEIGEGRLKVDAGKFVYVTALGQDEE